MPVRAVICDFYGTLAETKQSMPLEAVVAEFGYEVPPDVLAHWWNDGLDGAEHDEHSRSRDHYVAWQQSRVRAMLREAGVPATVHDALVARAREVSGTHLLEAYDEVAMVLAELRGRGVSLAVCSNWDWDLVEALDAAGITDAFDVLASSAWIGARKPHPRVYRHVIDELGVAPEDALFVGDTWRCDVDGPRAAGLRPVYVRRPHLAADRTAPPDHDLHDDVHRATDLTALLALV